MVLWGLKWVIPLENIKSQRNCLGMVHREVLMIGTANTGWLVHCGVYFNQKHFTQDCILQFVLI